MVTDKSTTMNKGPYQANGILKNYGNYVSTAAEKLRQRLIELQQHSSPLETEQKNPFLPNEVRQLKEHLKAQLEQADKYDTTMQSKNVANGYRASNDVNRETENVSISTHSKESMWNSKKETTNNDSVELLEKEVAMLRETLAKYQNMHPQSIERESISSTQNNTSVEPFSTWMHKESANKLKQSNSNGEYQQIDNSCITEQHKLEMDNTQQRILQQAQEEYQNALEKLKLASVSQVDRKTTDCQTVENCVHNNKKDKLLCPLHEYFSFSAPYIMKLDACLQSSGKEQEKQIVRLVQHSGIQEIKEMLFFCVDKLVQEMEVQQEEERKITNLERTLENMQMENRERVQQQQQVENQLRDELEKCQSDLSKAELALDVALSEKLVLENRTPALELCETLESRLEKLETRRNKREKELHSQIEDRNRVIEDLKNQVSIKDKETSRLYAEVQSLLENVEQLRKMWATQHKEQPRSRRRM